MEGKASDELGIADSQSEINQDEDKDVQDNDFVSTETACLLDVLEISVSDTEKRYNTGAVNLHDAYTVYLIETKMKGDKKNVRLANVANIWRRYSEFEIIKDYLQLTYPWVVVPPLPEKKASYPWQPTPTDHLTSDFVERRKAGLENFLLHVASHKILSFDEHFIQFLQQEHAWNESLSMAGYLGKADAKLRSLGASFMLKKPDKRFEETKNYSNEMYTNISNALKVHSKLSSRQAGIFKLHANYARVFAEWSSFEKQMSEGLLKATHLMNAYASLSNCLDEEEQFSDQMKEYLFFAESLRYVCRRQEMLQYEVERADANLSAKSTQRENLMQGKTGFLTRWFANVDTDEVRELKRQQLDVQVHEAESLCRQTSDNASEFAEKAIEDINRFQKQKVKDLKETLILYAILQIKLCKKAMSQWASLEECFEAM